MLKLAAEVLASSAVSKIEYFLLEVKMNGVSTDGAAKLKAPFEKMDWAELRQALQKCCSLRLVTFKATMMSDAVAAKTVIAEIVERELAEWRGRGRLEVSL